MRCTIKRLARGAIIAPAIIACSSTLQATGQPLFATLGDVGFNLVAVFSEVEGVRRKITKAVIAQQARRALQADAAPRRLGGGTERGGYETRVPADPHPTSLRRQESAYVAASFLRSGPPSFPPSPARGVSRGGGP